MKISVNTGGLQVNFADMVKDVKLIYTNVGNIPFLVDFVDPAGETKTTTVLPGERYTISSNAGNPTGGRLTFSTDSGQTYMVVSKVQEDSTVDGVDEKGYLAGTASKDDVTSLQQEVTTLSDTVDEVSSDVSGIETNITEINQDLQSVKVKTQNQSGSAGVTNFSGTTNLTNASVSGTLSVGSVELTEESLQESQDNISNLQTDVSALKTKTQNQSATSGNTSFTGNLTVSGTISTGSMSDIVGKVKQNQSAISGIQTDVSTLALSKLPYGTLYFNSGKLSGSNFAVPTFPFSICATVRIDAWRGTNENSQTIFQYGELGNDSGSTCALAFIDGESDPRLRLKISDKIEETNKSTSAECTLNLSSFLGKMHTIIGICRAVTDEALNWDIYIDGVKQAISYSLKNVIVSSLSSTRTWAVNTSNDNFSGQPASANPMMLRNLYIFNFDISAEDAPYSIADYEAGRLIPPALKPSQVSLALENYTIARNATTTLVKDTSGNSNDATVKGNVAGDNDQSIKVFVDEIKTQINQSNG